MSTIKATMITAAMATMATVDAAMTTRGSFPATWSRNLHGKRLVLGGVTAYWDREDEISAVESAAVEAVVAFLRAYAQ